MKNKGFTLIEMIVYMALFSIIMGGLAATAYQLSQGAQNTTAKVGAGEEINFVMKKIDWVLVGASNISVSADQKILTVTNSNLSPSTVVIKLNDTEKKIQMDNKNLTTENVEVRSLIFKKINTNPPGISIELDINGIVNTYTKYLRI